MNGFGRRALVSGLFALALLLMLFTEGTHPNTRSLIRLTRISISRPSLALLSTLWFTVCYSLPVNCRWRSGSVENTANTLQHFSSLVHFQYARIFLFIFSSPLFFFWRGGGRVFRQPLLLLLMLLLCWKAHQLQNWWWWRWWWCCKKKLYTADLNAIREKHSLRKETETMTLRQAENESGQTGTAHSFPRFLDGTATLSLAWARRGCRRRHRRTGLHQLLPCGLCNSCGHKVSAEELSSNWDACLQCLLVQARVQKILSFSPSSSVCLSFDCANPHTMIVVVGGAAFVDTSFSSSLPPAPAPPLPPLSMLMDAGWLLTVNCFQTKGQC